MPNYIGKREDEAFKLFNSPTVNDHEKAKLFNTLIHPAFKKLVDNLIYKYGQTQDDNVRDLRDDCISHLIYRISEYDYNKGNSFSFFNVVAKHFILQFIERKKKYSPLINAYRKDASESANGTDENIIKSVAVSSQFIDNSFEKAGESEEDEFFKYLQAELSKIIVNCNDKKEKEFLRHTITILENKDHVNIFSKKHFYASIKNMSSLKSREVTKYLYKLKVYYIKIREKYYECN